jgi:hypothetical protein
MCNDQVLLAKEEYENKELADQFVQVCTLTLDP